MQTTASYQKRHEVFENDLMALEAQVQMQLLTITIFCSIVELTSIKLIPSICSWTISRHLLQEALQVLFTFILHAHDFFVFFSPQLQVLMDDSSHLLKVYTSEELRNSIINSKEEILVKWSELQEMAELRKEKLAAAANYHHFQTSVSLSKLFYQFSRNMFKKDSHYF